MVYDRALDSAGERVGDRSTGRVIGGEAVARRTGEREDDVCSGRTGDEGTFCGPATGDAHLDGPPACIVTEDSESVGLRSAHR